jgi:hypothetical protein
MTNAARATTVGSLLALLALSAAAAPSPPPLSAYVGKYPSDKIRGIDFRHHPTVRRAVMDALLMNATVRRTVMEPGVEGPIERQGSFIVATVCEPHNCGDHQWAIVIHTPNGPASVCYHDQDLMGDQSRWFISSRPTFSTSGACSAGDHTPIPAHVTSALVNAVP